MLGQSVDASTSATIDGAFLCRVARSDVNLHCFRGRALRSPDLIEGFPPETSFCTRETFERVLRRSVLMTCPKIRWITGSATGLQTSPEDVERISAISVRYTSSQEEIIPAALVVGEFPLFLVVT